MICSCHQKIKRNINDASEACPKHISSEIFMIFFQKIPNMFLEELECPEHFPF